MNRSRQVLAALCALLLTAAGLAAQAATPYKIVTASEKGTYIQIGRDLARFVAPSADIDLEVLPSAGSAENIHRLRMEDGVKFALVQSDVYQAFINQGAAGHAEAAGIIRPLRVVMPLYNEEVYFIVRADSPLVHVHDIKDAKINVGPLRSGAPLRAPPREPRVLGEPMPDANVSFLSNEEALARLTTDKTLDVVIAVAGQPARLLTDMKPEARSLIRLLRLDGVHPSSQAVLKTYFPSTVRAAHYPNLLAEDVPGLAVKAFLVTYDYDRPHTKLNLTQFARSLCQRFPVLQSQGHPKWKEVELATPQLGQGWTYYPPMARELNQCIAEQARAARLAALKRCTTEQKILGLCE